MIEEYNHVFTYERLQYLDKRRVASVRHFLKAAAITVKSRDRLNLSEHEQDNRVYECALAAKAHYIVTENTEHFTTAYKYTKIVNARQLLRILAGDQPSIE